MVIDAIGDLFPAALAVALSPFPIVGVLMVLGGAGARTNGPLFAIGWAFGLAAVATLAVVVLDAVDDGDTGAGDAIGWVRLAAGIALLAFAATQWRKRPRPGEDAATPAWMASLDGVTASRALLLGAALSGINPKTVILSVAAGASIARFGLDTVDAALAILAFVVIGSATVAGAVVVNAVAPDRTATLLADVKQFMLDHDAAIMMVVLAILGAKLVGNGLADLAR